MSTPRKKPADLTYVTPKTKQAKRYPIGFRINTHGDATANPPTTQAMRDAIAGALTHVITGDSVSTGEIHLAISDANNNEAVPLHFYNKNRSCRVNVKDLLADLSIGVPIGMVAKVPAEIVEVEDQGPTAILYMKLHTLIKARKPTKDPNAEAAAAAAAAVAAAAAAAAAAATAAGQQKPNEKAGEKPTKNK